jgi:putative nucleotidyltransferase with HDIG domain
MSQLSVEAVTQAIKDLPVMSSVIGEIMSSLGNDNLNSETLAAKISHDQSLTAKTLKVANSPFYGVPRQVTSLQEAVSILGIRSVRSIVIASAVAGKFSPEQYPHFDFMAFWRHGMATALCAQAIADETDQPADKAFVLGLLHDIGRLVLAVLFPHDYSQALAYRAEHDSSLHEAELATLGIDHANVGAKLAERWSFPEEIVTAVASHHTPEANHITSAALVYVADNIVHALDLVGDPHEIVPPLDLLVWQAFGLTDAQCMTIFKQTESRLDAICSSLFA